MITNLRKIMDSSIVKRYHTCHTIKEQTTGAHQWGCGIICLALKPNCSKDVLVYALLHDVAEKVTGDIPAMVKRLYLTDCQFREQIGSLEKNFQPLPELSPLDVLIVRIADILELLWFCAKEIEMGNKNDDIVSCWKNGKDILKERITNIRALNTQGNEIGIHAETLFANLAQGAHLW